MTEQERFLHWEVAFPGVWADWESAEPKGGFDAVIGNPPWDRLKMQEVEWFAARKPEIALAQRAADRKRMIEALKKAKDPLYDQYELRPQRADQALELARDSGEYPLLGRGDVNIYSLFVERAQRLIKPDGIAGLLVPSGIASDKGAADFFRSIATVGATGRVARFRKPRTGRARFLSGRGQPVSSSARSWRRGKAQIEQGAVRVLPQ